MKRLTVLAIFAFVMVLVGSASIESAPPGPPGGLEVNVVSPLPLPVTGDVNATVTGAVNATVSGNVNVTNEELDVFIANEDTTPVPVAVREGITCPGPAVYQFIGNTIARTDRLAGHFAGLHAMCQAEFGPSARLCTDIEVFQSPQVTDPRPPEAAEVGWVQPAGLVPNYEPTSPYDLKVTTFDGMQTRLPSDLNCANWNTNTTWYGRIFNWDDGVFGSAPCSYTNIGVACCSPATGTP